MNFPSLFDLIDAELETNVRLAGSQHLEQDDARLWMRDAVAARVSPSGTTGITVALLSGERVVHERIFAASPLSVSRIVRTITEHLTGYVN
jgi:hypothetical protein